jgi:hypothetical protein
MALNSHLSANTTLSMENSKPLFVPCFSFKYVLYFIFSWASKWENDLLLYH